MLTDSSTLDFVLLSLSWLPELQLGSLMEGISFCGGYQQHCAGELCVFKKRKIREKRHAVSGKNYL